MPFMIDKIESVYIADKEGNKICDLAPPVDFKLSEPAATDFEVKSFNNTEFEITVTDKKTYFKFRNNLIGSGKSKVRYRLLNKARRMLCQ